MKAYGYNITRGSRIHRFCCCDTRNGCCERHNKNLEKAFKKRARFQNKLVIKSGLSEASKS